LFHEYSHEGIKAPRIKEKRKLTMKDTEYHGNKRNWFTSKFVLRVLVANAFVLDERYVSVYNPSFERIRER